VKIRRVSPSKMGKTGPKRVVPKTCRGIADPQKRQQKYNRALKREREDKAGAGGGYDFVKGLDRSIQGKHRSGRKKRVEVRERVVSQEGEEGSFIW